VPARGAPPDPVRQAARLRRIVVLGAWWLVVVVGLLWLVAGGPWILVVPLGVVGVLVAANTLVVVRHTGPEESALEPGRLRRADRERDPVAVWASRAPTRRAGGRTRRSGTLSYGGGHLSFTVDPSEPEGEGDDRLGDVTVLDARPTDLSLGARPTWRRPQLTVRHGGTVHVLDLSPPADLGAGAVGAVVAAAWWDQLAELGASTDR
jgi:hypothetical protein